MVNAPTVSVAGAGNVATHLATALRAAGCNISTIASHLGSSAAVLAAKVGARPVGVADIDPDSDFIIIAVSDRAVADVAAALPTSRAIVMHTSGSVPLSTLSQRHPRAGVFYPLQTFSRDVPVDMSVVPIFTEATDAASLERIDALARLLTPRVYHADSEHRQSLHIAGVLTSNFPVYLLDVASRVLGEAGYPLSVVKPLMEATVDKAFAVGPHDALTGPARRGDLTVTRAQAAALPPADAKIYNAITEAIIHTYHNEQN